jgi:hypothetical protein
MKMGKKLTRAEWLTRNKALPIALIERPLRYIANRTNYRNDKGELVLSSAFIVASGLAERGIGRGVQEIARSI